MAKKRYDSAPESAAQSGGNFRAYVGPTIKGLIRHGTVYRDNSEAMVLEDHPLVRALVISSDRLSQALRDLKSPDSALYANYHTLCEKYNTSTTKERR